MQGLAILDFIPNAKGRPSRIFRKWFSSKESACNAGDTGLIPGWEDPLKKEMATHSRVLTQQIPWTEEPGGLQSMGLQRVGHDLAIKQQQ